MDDEQACRRLGGDRALLREVAEIFLAEQGAMLADVVQAAKAGDAEATYRTAHRLKGAVGNFAADAAFEAARALEEAGRRAALQAAPAQIGVLEAEIARLVEALERMTGSSDRGA